VIADVVNYAVAGIGFIHAMGRLFVRKKFLGRHEHRYDANRDKAAGPMSGAGYFRSDRSFLNMLFKGFLHQLPLCDGPGIARIARHGFRTVAISILILGSLQLSAVPSQRRRATTAVTVLSTPVMIP
jgi:hypothetical protein